MTRVVDIPVIADADTGYGGPANIVRTVEEYIQSGVAAIHLEDQMAPKLRPACRYPADPGRRKCASPQMRDCGARRQDLLLIARTDAMPAAGAEEAIRRAKMYQDTGVDLVFVDGIKTIAEVEAVARHVEGPKVVSIVDGNETVALTATDLEQMGFNVVFYALSTLFSAVKAVSDTLSVLKRDGTPKARASDMITYQQYCDIVDLKSFRISMRNMAGHNRTSRGRRRRLPFQALSFFA